MAVTLTSTGITFSDGTNLTTAPSAGGLSYQVYNSSGTWNRASAGSPNTILAYGQGGSGSKRPRYQQASYSNTPSGPGTSGGAFAAEPMSVSSNVAITIGAGAATGTNFCGYYNVSCSETKAGGTTTVGGVSVNGGPTFRGNANDGYIVPNNFGTSNTATMVGVGLRSNVVDNTNNFAGVAGKAMIVW